jgi:hypothetical protein
MIRSGFSAESRIFLFPGKIKRAKTKFAACPHLGHSGPIKTQCLAHRHPNAKPTPAQTKEATGIIAAPSCVLNRDGTSHAQTDPPVIKNKKPNSSP